MVCRRCGRDNDPANQYCGRCGLELAPVAEEVLAAEARPCYRHPKELTMLSCGRCERPICTRCVVMGPAGPRCPECGRLNVKVSARGVAHDMTSSIRRLFAGGPFSMFWWMIIIILGFGLFRGCSPSPRVIHEPPEIRQEIPTPPD